MVEPASPPAVLHVEDEPAIRALVRITLTRAGYRVLEAPDGPDAVAALAADPGRVAAVLLDLNLPSMSGYAVLTELRRIRPGVPVILMSGSTEDGLDPDATEQPTLVLPKPFRGVDLTDAVRAVLPPRGA